MYRSKALPIYSIKEADDMKPYKGKWDGAIHLKCFSFIIQGSLLNALALIIHENNIEV